MNGTGRLIFSWALAGLSFWAGPMSAQDCTKYYWFDDQRSYCLSCGYGPPPWGTGSYYGHQLRYYLICQSCGKPCETAPYGESCTAVRSGGEHLRGALLYGIRSPQTAAGFDDLVRSAPEIALILFDRGITTEGARSSDMKRLEARTRRFITSEFVTLVVAGAHLDEGDANRLTREMADGQEILLEATTDVSDQGRAVLVLTSKLVRTGTQEAIRVLNHYLVHLRQVDGQLAQVEAYPSLTARVYDIVELETPGACAGCSADKRATLAGTSKNTAGSH